MRIGFYGDSFCTSRTTDLGFTTYIQKTADYYNAEIVNLGVGGSSVWDVIMLQYPKENPPDISVFCWTSPDRLFHRTCRRLTHNIHKHQLPDSDLQIAASMYFKHLHDVEKSTLEAKAAMYYFDNTVLKYSPSKIVHLWSFGKNYQELDYTEVYTFTHGNDTSLSLVDLAEFGHAYPNHIYGDENNNKIFEIIKNAVDSQ